ncbi:NAD(P)/FAD-dependent oxidoreductase [Archangium lansingense]|uniref:NAD(P)/FAD-dependent oxidoreductase n=1 Tax=Archangium lansingense TaxID=2995310 RepID=UPI003B821803
MRTDSERKDVVIIGGGPAGLSAALMLGRARKKVLLCDGGSPRNSAAEGIHGFVTRDGIPPKEFRRIAHEELQPYGVEILTDTRVTAVERLDAGFQVVLAGGRTVESRRILLATGMVDEPPDLPGYRDLWGASIFQCPYCHGWEVRDRPFGLLVTNEHLLDFAVFLTGWTRDVVAFTHGVVNVSAEQRQRLERAGVRLETQKIRRLIPGAKNGDHRAHLEAVELEDGTRVARDVLFAHPPQRQTELVQRLGVALDEQGFVRINEHLETSIPGVHAAGDLTTRIQGASMAAAAGTMAAAMMNHALNMENAGTGVPPRG